MVRKVIDKYKNITYYNEQGQLHREDGPAIEYSTGNKEWYISGFRHRADGPAIEFINGYKAWFINGRRHRIDGPAEECYNGSKYYYIMNKRYFYEDWLAIKDFSLLW